MVGYHEPVERARQAYRLPGRGDYFLTARADLERMHASLIAALKNNVQIFDPTGRLVLQFGMRGLQPGQFRLPAGICITEDNRIFVVDSINQRIQEFRYLPKGQGSDES